jgi:hypothetical protein
LKSGSTPGRPDLGKREIKTSARLRDGETAIFGGLLKDEEQKSLQGIWGLSDIPLLGRLFGNTRNNKAKTDVILTIRAVLVRKPVITEQDMAPFNPEDAKADSGPFKPTEAKAVPAKPAASAVAPKSSPAPTAPPVGTKPDAAPQPPEGLKPAAMPPTDAGSEKLPGAAAAAPAAAPAPAPSDLVIFMSPVAAEIKAGERVRLSLTVSGGQGLTNGSLELRLPAGLRLQSAVPGEFITAEGGSFEQFPGKDGALRLVFRRNGAGVDSGQLAVLELEGLAAGNAPVLIQSGQFMAGANPISGRWSNALVTVQ